MVCLALADRLFLGRNLKIKQECYSECAIRVHVKKKSIFADIFGNRT